uniref:Early endosome antigen 1 n=1 Tax=Anthurium amnicola TaxID=1678845 RepID=A0A1D1YEZ9_9ARAE
MNDPSRMTNRSFGIWPPPIPPPPGGDDLIGFGNPRPVFSAGGAKPGRVKWKGRKAAADKRKKAGAGDSGAVQDAGASGYRPPALSDLQSQNRAKAFRFYPKKKFARFAPLAPRNTTSFIIRAKKSGGIASLVSPCPVTPAILPTPKFSPSREGLVDMAKEEWGVDGYGSMTGLIRLRPPTAKEDDDGDDMGEGSSESEVEEHAEVERRLDHDLSRFEMVYPSTGEEHALESRVDEQDAHIARLQEEILTLREKLLLMEREMGDVRRRLQLLEDNIYDDGGNTSMNLVVEAWNEGGGGDVSSEQSVGD